MRGSTLLPRDSAAPKVWEADEGLGVFSPNGDGDAGQLDADARAVRARLVDAPHPRRQRQRQGAHERRRRHRRDDLGAVLGLRRRRHLPLGDRGDRRLGQRPARGGRHGQGRHPGAGAVAGRRRCRGRRRRSPPTATATARPSRSRARPSEPGSLVAKAIDADDDLVDSFSAALSGGAGTLTWDGKTSDGFAADGRYTISVRAKDRGRQPSAPRRPGPVDLYAALGFVDVLAHRVLPAGRRRAGRRRRRSRCGSCRRRR